jgi:hypothetical protein
MAPAEKQRVLTPEEQARRAAALAGGDPMKTRALPPVKVQVGGQPVIESLPQRVARATRTPKPFFIDHDRDGYPDAIVGRGQRNLRERAMARGSGGRPVAYGGRPGLGLDSYRQDQVGYRDRIRGMLEAAVQLANRDDKDEPLDARTRAMAAMPVLSHAGTGVPGGMPAFRTLPGRQVASRVPRYTPSQQAAMAPRTIPPGIPRNPAQRARTQAGDPLAPDLRAGSPTDLAPGIPRQSGGMAVQGYLSTTGTFTVPDVGPPGTGGAKAAPGKAAEQHARAAEPHAKAAEQHARPAGGQPAKPAEHAKPYEPTKPSQEHAKPPEPKK